MWREAEQSLRGESINFCHWARWELGSVFHPVDSFPKSAECLPAFFERASVGVKLMVDVFPHVQPYLTALLRHLMGEVPDHID